MRKQITILKGSPRVNGNTNTLTSIVENHLSAACLAVKSFSLYNMNILPCTACRICQEDWSRVTCRQNDDFACISDSIINSELIIFSTPIYSWYCTPPMKALMDRMVYAFNMYYGEKRGPSLWEGKYAAIITTCGYPPEKGADLFEEGIKRYCKHSHLNYLGILSEHHKGYQTTFIDDDKIAHAEKFSNFLLDNPLKKV